MKFRWKFSRPKKSKVWKSYLIEQFSVSDKRKWAEFYREVLKYHWNWYNELSYQREQIIDKIHASISGAAEGAFCLSKWERVVKYKWCLQPLSARGSVSDEGGRFNIGSIRKHYPPFPALYIAEDRETALCEVLGQSPSANREGFTSFELALTNPQSVSAISVSGSMESIINLNEPGKLHGFVELVKDFRVSEAVKKAARKLKLPDPILIRSVDDLLRELLRPDWRIWPMQFDVPSTSQIFGQIVTAAGVEAILYPSKLTDRPCMAIFPSTFSNSSS